MSRRKASRLGAAWALIAVLLKIIVSVFVLATPVIGVWTASSLAAYRGQALWAPIFAGLLAFPVVPLVWDALAQWRRNKKKPGAERILTFYDRLLLRTFAVSFTGLALLLAVQPEAAFTALSTRGDWMLPRQGYSTARRGLFRAAAGLEWLYEWAHENEFEKFAPEDANPELDDLESGEVATRDGSTEPDDTRPEATDRDDARSEPERDDPSRALAPPRWPSAVRLHPAVASMPVSVETDISSVGRYIAERTANPFERVKAIHDYVADRIAYDAPSYVAGRYPPQDARSVFQRKNGVCAGYARLMRAIGQAADAEIVYLTGNVRQDDDSAGGSSHAWNAARIRDRWYLVDATWDAGFVDGPRFEKSFRTVYLFTPPEAFGMDHFPDEARWQLRENPLSRGEFMRQPMLRAEFFARGLELLRPDRSMVSVPGPSFDLSIGNQSGQHLMAQVGLEDGTRNERCSVGTGKTVAVRCPLPTAGVYRVKLFAGPERYGTFTYVGSVDGVRR